MNLKGAEFRCMVSSETLVGWSVVSNAFPPHGLWPARLLCPWDSLGKSAGEWVAISSSRGSSRPWDWTCISCIGRQILYQCTTWEAPQTLGSLAKELAQEMVWGSSGRCWGGGWPGCHSTWPRVPRGWAVHHPEGMSSLPLGAGAAGSALPSRSVAMWIIQLWRHRTGISKKHSAAERAGGRGSHNQIFCYWLISGKSRIL